MLLPTYTLPCDFWAIGCNTAVQLHLLELLHPKGRATLTHHPMNFGTVCLTQNPDYTGMYAE
eukprot:4422884-Amphidinium_carterae.1